MRHTFLCLIVAVLVAIACLVLTPTIGLLLLFMLNPKIFDDDTLLWIWAFGWPVLLGLELAVTIAVGSGAFLMAKAKLPDRGWESGQTFVILMAFAATITAAALIAWPYFETPPELSPQQAGLPTLHLARTLRDTGTKSVLGSPLRLAWSADGERLAAYGGAGILTWSPDGQYRKEFSLYSSLSSRDVLRFLSSRRLLITGPVAEVNSAADMSRIGELAFSVVDSETGQVLQEVPGARPGGGMPYNAPTDLAISPDERFIAVICCRAKPQINIYSTQDWKQVTTIDIQTADRGRPLNPMGLAFSPDGKELAIIGSASRIAFFEVGSWTPSGSLATYSDVQSTVFGLGALAFSPDEAMIAVGSGTGGTRWEYPRGIIALPGSGAFRQDFPADPLRVFRVSDRKLVASLGSFPGGLSRSGLIWSPNSEYLAFYDALGAIRLWNPLRPGLSVVVARGGTHYDNLLFSRDGSRMAANFPDGVRVFDVVPPH